MPRLWESNIPGSSPRWAVLRTSQLEAIRRPPPPLTHPPYRCLWKIVLPLQLLFDLRSICFKAVSSSPIPLSFLLPRADTKMFLHFLKSPGRSVYGCSKAAHICAQFSWESWKLRNWSLLRFGAQLSEKNEFVFLQIDSRSPVPCTQVCQHILRTISSMFSQDIEPTYTHKASTLRSVTHM